MRFVKLVVFCLFWEGNATQWWWWISFSL